MSRKRKKTKSSRPISTDPELTCAKLDDLWRRSDPNAADAVWLLASHLHGALLGEIRRVYLKKNPNSNQAHSYLGNFLSVERRQMEPIRIYQQLRTLTQLGSWLDRFSDDTMSQRLFEHYPQVLLSAAGQIIDDFRASQPEVDMLSLLSMKDFPEKMLLNDGLIRVYSVWYVPAAIRGSLSLLLALNPKDQYPEARAMKRHFILHLGGTNTGKTYAGFQRLIQAETGVYLGPLRLLALEAQETLLDAGVACGLCTGEEEDLRPGDTHVASTAEKLDMKRFFDVAVVDECQMVADLQRGYA